MRIWVFICTVLSGLLAALRICAIYSCSDMYLIDDRGQPTVEVKREPPYPEAEKEYSVFTWREKFPEILHASERALPNKK